MVFPSFGLSVSIYGDVGEFLVAPVVARERCMGFRLGEDDTSLERTGDNCEAVPAAGFWTAPSVRPSVGRRGSGRDWRNRSRCARGDGADAPPRPQS